jgi:hypothetical protein
MIIRLIRRGMAEEGAVSVPLRRMPPSTASTLVAGVEGAEATAVLEVE